MRGGKHTIMAAEIKEQKERENRLRALRERKPKAVEWAKRVGLTHWHEAGWGCSAKCLEGVGEQFDPDSRARPVYAPLKSKKGVPGKKPSQRLLGEVMNEYRQFLIKGGERA